MNDAEQEGKDIPSVKYVCERVLNKAREVALDAEVNLETSIKVYFDKHNAGNSSTHREPHLPYTYFEKKQITTSQKEIVCICIQIAGPTPPRPRHTNRHSFSYGDFLRAHTHRRARVLDVVGK